MIKRQAEAVIPSQWGNFKMLAYAENEADWMPHVALFCEKNTEKPFLVRIHSECMTGDVFGSKRCDCGEQLINALNMIGEQGGLLIYLRQEGRGIGLINKLKAYNLQDEGMNTAEANTHLGFDVDSRQYNDAITILNDLGIKKIKLITNNPLKVNSFDNSTIEVAERVPLVMTPNEDNLGYFKTKRDLMGHFFGEFL